MGGVMMSVVQQEMYQEQEGVMLLLAVVLLGLKMHFQHCKSKVVVVVECKEVVVGKEEEGSQVPSPRKRAILETVVTCQVLVVVQLLEIIVIFQVLDQQEHPN